MHKKTKILVIGDIMLDKYVSGNVNRISPEAPIPILKYDHQFTVMGGAGNVAANVLALGAEPILVGVIGKKDPNNRLLEDMAAKIELLVAQESDRLTTVKTRFMAGSHQMLRLDEESTNPIDDQSKALILLHVERKINSVDAVILSDYNKGVLQPDLIAHIIDIATKAGKPVIVDPKRKSFTDYESATVITPNIQETFEATGIRVVDDESAVKAGNLMLFTTSAKAIIITRSEKGISVIFQDKPPLHLPTKAQEVTDVSGAGDTLVAAFAVMIAEDKNITDAATIANVAAGISVGKLGTSAVNRHELDDAMLVRKETHAKITDRDTAVLRVEDAKKEGKKVGFTNGCFDILHPGHIELLIKAREACDYLVIGLNSDASVKRLKGPERPIQSETARALILSTLQPVDMVVVFDENTPLELVTLLQPNVLIKGGDYQNKEVVGSDVVKASGGEVLLIDLEVGFSTTNLVDRIKSA
jgi:D-beta-D-heptose 7-phosphate kinase/D-beta-D-heptose 1-phosphate adenosyltransferase